MRSARDRTEPLRPLVRGISLLGGTTAFAVILLLISFAPGTAASSAWTPTDPVAWSNGVVLCEFAATQPAVNVSAVSLAETGLTLNVAGMSEVRPDGSTAAVANLTGVTWQVWNNSGEDAFDLAFAATVPLELPGGGVAVVGSANLRVDFVLPAYAGSPEGATDIVTAVLTVSNWTWQASGDHLAASMTAWVTYTGSERLIGPGSPGRILTGTSTGSQGDLQWMGFRPTATVESETGGTANTTATPQLTSLSSDSASIVVNFGSAGSFQSLVFSTQVGIILPSSIAGIPTTYFLAVGGAAVGVSLVVAVVTRRVRNRPSRLTYVEEEL